MHDILTERDESLPEVQYQNILKSVINRERRKVYREIYDYLMKRCRDLKLNDQLSKDQKKIVDDLNAVKKLFLELKQEDLFLELSTGKLDLKALKDTPVHFSNAEFFINLQNFMLKIDNLMRKIQDNIHDIIEYKRKEQQYLEDQLEKAIAETQSELNQLEPKIGLSSDLKDLIEKEFDVNKKIKYFPITSPKKNKTITPLNSNSEDSLKRTFSKKKRRKKILPTKSKTRHSHRFRPRARTTTSKECTSVSPKNKGKRKNLKGT